MYTFILFMLLFFALDLYQKKFHFIKEWFLIVLQSKCFFDKCICCFTTVFLFHYILIMLFCVAFCFVAMMQL